MPERIAVTDHALDRWRERFAADGAAKAPEIADALRESRFIEDGEPLPFTRRPDTAYYFHPATGAFFVVEGLNASSARVVTVIDPATPVNYLTPKFAADRKAAERAPEVTADSAAAYREKKAAADARGTQAFHDAMRKTGIVPASSRPGESSEEELARHSARRLEIQLAIAGMTKLDKKRAPLVREFMGIDLRVRPLRIRVKDERMSREEFWGGQTRRPDGGYNYGPCIAHLMRRDAERDEEMAALRERVAELERLLAEGAAR